MGRMIEIFEPIVPYQDVSATKTNLVPRPASLEGKRIGFIANWKHPSLPFMEAIAKVSSRAWRLKEASAFHPEWDTPNEARMKAIEPEFSAIVKKYDLMVIGIGD